jgi:hypothetical protein
LYGAVALAARLVQVEGGIRGCQVNPATFAIWAFQDDGEVALRKRNAG